MAKITQSVDLSSRGRVAVLTVDNPPVNALSQHVRKGLHDGIKQAIADSTVQAIVIVCSGRTFIAGADITEFGKPPVEPGLFAVLDMIEGSPKPVVSAIHGTALGGGLEVTLACHYRVGVKSARFGLPEVNLPFAEGLKRERELFVELLNSPESKAQRYFFFAEREAAKIPDVAADTPAKEIKKAAVIGAGTMGGGIAMNFANAGIPVTVVEVAQDVLDRGLAVVRKNYAATVEKGRLSQADMDKRMGLITGSLDRAAVREADIVIEAVFEEMGVKKEVFAALDKIARPGAVLASNTSTLDIDQIASATSRPEAVIGTHFFSPANVMRLLELVRGAKTSKETIATSAELSRRIGKVWVLAGHCDGLIGKRMLHPYLRQAGVLVEECATPQQVDKVIYDFGFAMGPFAMQDLAGNDVGWRIRKGKAAARRKDLRYSHVGDRLCEQGRFGQKTGAGWYRYEAGSRVPKPDPEGEAIIAACAKEGGIERRQGGDEEVLKRCVWALVNEGARILEEGIALRASDIDLTYLYGYGFPRYRGGPMFYADQVGLTQVLADVAAFHTSHGEPWAPAPLLERLAKEGKGFRDFGAR